MASAFRIFAHRRTLRFQIEGDGAPRTLSLSASSVVAIGRDDDCQVRLLASEVSRKHLSIFANGAQLFVRDHSARGTRVNGQLLRLAVRRFVAPALLEIGPYRVQVSVLRIDQRLREWLACRAKPVRRRVVAALAALLASAALIALAGRRTPALPPVAAAECGAGAGMLEAALAQAASRREVPSALQAALLLREGRKLEAWLAYRALSAQPNSPAPFGIVAGILEYELSCAR